MYDTKKIPRKLKKRCKTAYNKSLIYRGKEKIKTSTMRILEANGQGYMIQL